MLAGTNLALIGDKVKHYAKNGDKVLAGAVVVFLGFQQMQTGYSYFGAAYNDVRNLRERISSWFE